MSALTGAYMSLTTFGFVPDGMEAEPAFPTVVSGGPPMPLSDIPALQQTAVSTLRELSLPYATDPKDVVTLTTNRGMGYIDQSSGVMLEWLDNGTARQIYEFIYMLSGAVTYRHADRSYLLQPGDSLFFDSEAPHGPEELRRLPARYLSIIVSVNEGVS